MKLIDLLVQELPKRGGWPEGIKGIEQNVSGFLFDSLRPSNPFLFDRHGFEVTDEWRTEIVTREQYESALAASQKVEWDGEGLPPVGCKCERSCTGDKWLQCKIIFTSDEIVLVKFATREAAYRLSDVKFRPIRSETDKKRDEAAKGLIEYLDKETDIDNVFSIKDVIGFYDAIAAGKIPHIRID